MNGIELQNWTLQRDTKFSVGPIDVAVGSGQVMTVMGASGVGKTTLLLSILGYRETGLSVHGRRLQNGKLLASGEIPANAVYIPQKYPFNPNWEVLPFLCRLPWERWSVMDVVWPTHRRRRERVMAVLTELGIGHRARAPVSELSGGEVQRAALAQLLLLTPEIVVADEFVSALDAATVIMILDACRERIVSSEATAILALHNVEAALRVSDVIMILHPSRSVEVPWVFQRRSDQWRTDILNTALCLSKWSMDENRPSATAVVRLFRQMMTQRELPKDIVTLGQGMMVEITSEGTRRLEKPDAETERRLMFVQQTGVIEPWTVTTGNRKKIGFIMPIPEAAKVIAVIEA